MLESSTSKRELSEGMTLRTGLGALAGRVPRMALIFPVLLVAAGTRLHDLGSKSVWLDEAYSLFVARQPLDRIIDLTVRHDTPPPLYYVLLHFWLAFGSDPFSARLLSALLGMLGVVAIYLLGREVAGERVGLIAGLLLAVSPFQVWYGQETRMYSLLALLCTFSAYSLLRAMRTEQAAWWAAYVLATTLALYTQLSATFFLVAEGVAFLLVARPVVVAAGFSLRAPLWSGLLESEGTRTLKGAATTADVLRPWLISQLLIAVLWLPWLPNAVLQAQNYQQFWIAGPSLSTVATLMYELTSAYLPHWKVPYAQELLGGGGLLLALLAMLNLDRKKYFFLVVLLAMPVAAMYLVSLSKPIFLSRALIYLSAPYLVLLAASIAGARRWRLGRLLLGVLLLLNLVSLNRLYSFTPKEEWDLAASFVTSRAEEGDLVLFLAADTQIAFDYYSQSSDKRFEERGLPVDVFSVGPLQPVVKAEGLNRMDELIDGRSSFWLVESHTDFVDPQRSVRRHANERYRLVESRAFYLIDVLRYQSLAPMPAGGVLER